MKLKQRDWRIWLGVVTVAYVVIEAVRTKVSDASTLIVVWVGKGALWLVSQPMGVGGLFLLGYIVVLVGLSWWQTRPKAKPKSASAPVISDADRKIIQDLRTVWNRYGCETVTQVANILKEVSSDLKQRTYWAVLLDRVTEELDHSIEGMTKAVAFDTKMSVKQVREQFNEMYSSYLSAIKWVARLESHGDITLEAKRLEWWQDSHYLFYDKLVDLTHAPEHYRTLSIFLQLFMEDEAFNKFMKTAQRPRLPPERGE